MSISRFLIAITILGAASVASAQEWPTKAVKFVSPYPPGGSVDPLARLFAAKLSVSLKQQFIVENRTGASDRKSTRLNSSHSQISYAVFCLKKKKIQCSTSYCRSN